jgi:hypothetical protein
MLLAALASLDIQPFVRSNYAAILDIFLVTGSIQKRV